jgi:hypothetical protein
MTISATIDGYFAYAPSFERYGLSQIDKSGYRVLSHRVGKISQIKPS